MRQFLTEFSKYWEKRTKKKKKQFVLFSFRSFERQTSPLRNMLATHKTTNVEIWFNDLSLPLWLMNSKSIFGVFLFFATEHPKSDNFFTNEQQHYLWRKARANAKSSFKSDGPHYFCACFLCLLWWTCQMDGRFAGTRITCLSATMWAFHTRTVWAALETIGSCQWCQRTLTCHMKDCHGKQIWLLSVQASSPAPVPGRETPLQN